MSDEFIGDLNELTAVADEDILPIVDDPSGSPETKKITRGSLVAGLSPDDHDHDADYEAAGAVATHAGLGDPHPGYTTAAELAAYAQPLDSDLTAIAALSTSAFGRALLELADAAALRTAGAVVIGTNVQAWDADLDAIAALGVTNDSIIQGKAGVWAKRTIAQLLTDLAAAGTTVQPLDSDLTAIAALTTTAYGRSLLAAADAAALRTLGEVIKHTRASAAPGSPTTGDLWTDTDTDELYFYNGTRWLSQQKYYTFALTTPQTATGTQRVGIQDPNGQDKWAVRATCGFWIQSGGSALSGSHKWELAVTKEMAGDAPGSGTSLATFSIASGNSNEQRSMTPVAIGALLGATVNGIQFQWTKTGTPGNLFVALGIEWRLVG